MSGTRKPILCLDFDGVIHSYGSGWKGADVIPDPLVPGALEFIVAASEDFAVAVYSSRSGQPGGIEAMKAYVWAGFVDAGMVYSGVRDVFAALQWPVAKPSAMITIDDRAITFTGEWPTIETLKAFKPWNKRDPIDEPFVRMGTAATAAVRIAEKHLAGQPSDKRKALALDIMAAIAEEAGLMAMAALQDARKLEPWPSEAEVLMVAGLLRGKGLLRGECGQIEHDGVRHALKAVMGPAR